MNDHVNSTMLQQKFTALEALGQLLTDSLFNNIRTRKPCPRAWFRRIDITQQCKACRNTTVDRMSHNGDITRALHLQALDDSTGSSHLHQGDQRLLHPRTTGCRKADQRNIFFKCHFSCTSKTLTYHISHGATVKCKLKSNRYNRHTFKLAFHSDQRIFFTCSLLRCGVYVY